MRLLFGFIMLTMIAACAPSPSQPTLPPTAAPASASPPAEAPAPTETVPSPPPATDTPLPPPPPPPAPTVTVTGPAQALVASVTQDLSLRAAVDPAKIAVLEVSSQFWPDASLGCPEPGKLYAQIIVEGFRIVLEAEGKKYAYHTDQANFILCASVTNSSQPTP